MDKKTFLGFDITPRKALWAEVEEATEMLGREIAESGCLIEEILKLRASLDAAERERISLLRERARLDEKLGRYKRQRGKGGKFIKGPYVAGKHTAASDTIILPGLPHLEWMTENLSGFGGTEIDGVTYYTHDQAVEAVKQLGDGWRLPTRGEMLDLDDLGSTWDDDREGRWFGGNHDTNHAGSLFLPASGYRERSSGAATCVGSSGYYWSSAPAGSGSANAGYLGFSATGVNPLDSGSRAYGFTVRCVRDMR